jgi:hypothetical protein
MRKTLIDTDKLNLVGLRKVGNVAMAITDKVQHYTPEERVVGAAAFFLLLARRYRIEPGEAFRVAERVIRFQHEGRPELAAAQAYMEHELR